MNLLLDLMRKSKQTNNMKQVLPWRIALSVFSFLCLVSMHSQATAVISVKPVLKQGHLRITIDTPEKVKFRHFTLSNPARVVLYLQNTTLKSIPDTKLFKRHPLKSLRHGIHDLRNLQLIFDLDNPIDYKIETAFNAEREQHQLIIIFKSPEFIASPVKKIEISRISSRGEKKTGSTKNKIEQPPSVKNNHKDAVHIPTMIFEKMAETELQESNNRVVNSFSIADKLEANSRIDVNGYGTFGILHYPKESTKKSRRIDLGYKSTIGAVDFGISMVKPLFFVETEFNDTNIKFLIKEDDNSSGAEANLGVTLEW